MKAIRALALGCVIVSTVLATPGRVAAQDIEVTPLAWDYGLVEVGESPTRVFTITSTTVIPLTVTSVQIVDDPAGFFTIVSDAPPPSVTLFEGESIDVTVEYAPPLSGTHSATLLIQSDAAPPSNNLDLPLSGLGVGVVEVVPVSVPGTANIYGAGHAVAPAPGGGGAGVLPTEVAIPAGVQRIVRLTSVTGSVDFGSCCAPNGPDGVPGLGQGPSISWDGIGGMTIARGRFLSAVFLDDSEPSDPPPAPLVISDIGFASLSPGLRQCFFVGDGLTGTGTGDRQLIQVPQGATRLFLGLHDAGPPDNSLPGWYGDNSGGFSGNVEIAAMREVPSMGLRARLVLVVTLVLSIAAVDSIRAQGRARS